jgi:hypothetical protein
MPVAEEIGRHTGRTVKLVKFRRGEISEVG